MTASGCPKDMQYGPCGGVRNAGECEVDARPCPFLNLDIDAPPPLAALTLPLPSPTIIVDVRAPRNWTGDAIALWHRTAERLQGCTALLGEHVDNPALQDDAGCLPPHRVIEILTSGGVATIATITGRDRNLASACATIREYRDAGAVAIHCVTGDHPASIGIDRPAHFGTEAMELVAASVEEGIAATVGESPASPGPRAQRVRAKESAGASLCILNHSGDSTDLIAFADACRALGSRIPLIAPVPMIGDKQA
ncbi:MAG: methylenetetrahydrofolate reductase C-terminal domain-containing protein, partial [Mycobacterium sp.]